MGTEQDIKIGIKTKADTRGAEEASKALKDVGRSAAAVEKPMSKLGSAAGARKGSGAAAGIEKVAAASSKAKKSTRNMGMATLEASRAFEDMQYGLRGALNNIPGLVMMLGGTAGIAGAASAAAVAVSILAPQLQEMFGSKEDPKVLEELNEKLSTLAKKAQKAAHEMEAVAQKKFAESIDAVVGALKLENSEFQRNIKLSQEKRKARIALIAVEKELALAMVESTPGLSADARSQRRSEIELRAAGSVSGLKQEARDEQVSIARAAFESARQQGESVAAAVGAAELRLRSLEVERADLAKQNAAIAETQAVRLRMVERAELQTTSGPGGGMAITTMQALDEKRKEQDLLSKFENIARGFSPDDASRLKDLGGSELDVGSIKQMAKELEELTKQAGAAAVEISEANARLKLAEDIHAIGGKTAESAGDSAGALQRSAAAQGRLGDARTQGSEEINAALDALLEQSNEGAQEVASKLRELVADGLQASEEPEAVQLLNQIIGKFSGDASTRAGVYSEFLAVLSAAAEADRNIMREVTKMRQEFEALQDNVSGQLGNQNP